MDNYEDYTNEELIEALEELEYENSMLRDAIIKASELKTVFAMDEDKNSLEFMVYKAYFDIEAYNSLVEHKGKSITQEEYESFKRIIFKKMVSILNQK